MTTSKEAESIFHIPLNMNSTMLKIMAGVSLWKSDHYLAITKEAPGAGMMRMSVIYPAKVFEAPFKNMRNWYNELIAFVRSKGKELVETYFNYTMCPNCAKAYGHNYVVGFTQVS